MTGVKGRDRSYKVSIRNFLFTVPLVGGKLGQRAQVVPWAPLYSVTRKAELPPILLQGSVTGPRQGGSCAISQRRVGESGRTVSSSLKIKYVGEASSSGHRE